VAKTILVAGDAGFIGAKLKAELESAGHRVLGYDRQHGKELLDLAAVERVVSSVDVVYNLAAQPDLTEMAGSVASARDGVRDNVEATHNLAFACAKHGVWLIHASTLSVYGASTEQLSLEDGTLPQPREIYGCSKYASEAIVAGYGHSFGMPWTILRIATIYGPRMRPGLGLHIFLRQAIAGDPITLHGDGSQVRALTFIDDLVAGMMRPLERPDQARGQVINLASAEVMSARAMAEDVVRITGSRSPIVSVPQRKHQIMCERIDTTKARELLGWTAETPWTTGLEQTYRWILQA